ncbi:hypothetical protein V9T40_003406 [Parthenolecanium corni]|uniref:Uncharacterized protein n=1 Tax=Parthenolecanium corni TaxID=536013 RepID=A0AAN9YA46_9HEMI
MKTELGIKETYNRLQTLQVRNCKSYVQQLSTNPVSYLTERATWHEVSIVSLEARPPTRMRTRFRANFAATNCGATPDTPYTPRSTSTSWSARLQYLNLQLKEQN